MRYDRDDDMVITGKRHDFASITAPGWMMQGRILGVTFTASHPLRLELDLTLPVADRAMLHADNAYWLPHIRIESHRLRTNTQSATAFRGFGGPQGVVGIERVMDHVAHALRLDPLAVRRVNFYARRWRAPGASPRTPGVLLPKVRSRGADHALSHAGRGFHCCTRWWRELEARRITRPAGGECALERRQPDPEARHRADAR
jgi:xanthine dehydrogenase large subunit